MKRFIAGVVVGMVLAGGVVYAQDTQTKYNGQAFIREWLNDWRLFFAIGWSIGFGLGSIDSPYSPVRTMRSCIRQWSGGQTQAVIETYIRDNPSEWHESIAVLSLKAIKKACPVQ